ncbi:thermonuclease family protein [Nitratireductor sp. GCM10026969]|uniref:thermonuclease family protein n=1 Tax=Nitratireductor sp. GCM10026969 TaxID=3252645 RepID=UPI0036126D42
MDGVIAAALLTVVALVAAQFDRKAMRALSGPVRIADGDSLVIEGERIRLHGIDAPELGQSCRRDEAAYDCGRRARQELVWLAERRDVTCRGAERDRYGRLLARCEAGEQDLGLTMVESGWAIAYGDHFEAEAAARRARRGLWAGTFEQPAQWRVAREEREDPVQRLVARFLDFLWHLLPGENGGEANETL